MTVEAQLKGAEEERLRALFDSIDEGFCLCEIVLDDAGRPTDYVFLEVNPCFEEMTGLRGPVGRSARDLEQHWVDTYARAALGGERFRFQQSSEAMGRWFDVFAMPFGDPGQFAIVFKDDSARRHTETALRASEARLRDQVLREHRASIRLQRALLPSSIVEHPQVQIRAGYRAGSTNDEVGGDWYDTFSWPSGEIGIMVGDVVGHSLEAAVRMGRLRAGVAALARRLPPDPAAPIDALDGCVRSPDGAAFVTAACVVVAPETGVMTYSSAGHPPGLVASASREVRWLDGAQAPPLGMVVVTDRPTQTEMLEAGSTLVLYSDGLLERRGEVIDEGMARLRAAAERLGADASDHACDRLIEDSLGGSEHADDIVVVIARWSAPEA
jgi:serine phosphatase RsbU (regulator of sigma subunit)